MKFLMYFQYIAEFNDPKLNVINTVTVIVTFLKKFDHF